MRPILLSIAAVLSFILYRMISRGGRTYRYTHTQFITLDLDGMENSTQINGKGSITINNKFVVIDGKEYCYAPMKGEEMQALLEYNNKELESVRIIQHDGFKRFMLEQVQPVFKGNPKTA
jgi:hypothetical protein